MNRNAFITLCTELFQRELGESVKTVLIDEEMTESRYCLIEKVIELGKKYKGGNQLMLPFIWFHEAYHHIQFTVDGREWNNTTFYSQDMFNSEDYYFMIYEIEANAFAYYMCKKYNVPFTMPNYLPVGYEDALKNYKW